MFGQIMSIPDALTARYALLATDMTAEDVQAVAETSRLGGPEAGEAKRRVARRVVTLYHGADAAAAAEAAFDRQFKRHEAPEEVPQATRPADAVDGEIVYLPRVLADLGLVKSRGEARRLLAQGGVKVNGEPVTGEEVALDELSGGLLQVGKRRFIRVTGP